MEPRVSVDSKPISPYCVRGWGDGGEGHNALVAREDSTHDGQGTLDKSELKLEVGEEKEY